jgi:hypothetical protein
MKTVWFKSFGWTYRPASWQGAVIATIAILFCAQVFWAVDRRSHSASDTLYGVFPYFVSCFLLLNWIAQNTSGSKSSSVVQ